MIEIGGWKLDLGGWRGRQGGGSHATHPDPPQRIGLLVPKKNLPKEEEEEEEEGFEGLEVWSLEEDALSLDRTRLNGLRKLRHGGGF